jgi:hypothetical protein
VHDQHIDEELADIDGTPLTHILSRYLYVYMYVYVYVCICTYIADRARPAHRRGARRHRRYTTHTYLI